MATQVDHAMSISNAHVHFDLNQDMSPSNMYPKGSLPHLSYASAIMYHHPIYLPSTTMTSALVLRTPPQ